MKKPQTLRKGIIVFIISYFTIATFFEVIISLMCAYILNIKTMSDVASLIISVLIWFAAFIISMHISNLNPITNKAFEKLHDKGKK